jgi:2-methylcitrate dehydratase PrpD
MFQRIEVDVDPELTAAFPERRLTAVEIELTGGGRLAAEAMEAPGEPEDPALPRLVAAKAEALIGPRADGGPASAGSDRGLHALDGDQLLTLLCDIEEVMGRA